jgi:preprotein translocase subunit YajC
MSFLSTIVHAATPAPAPGLFGTGIDPLTIGLVLLLAVMVIFMIRNSRKRKRDAEELKNKFVPGAEVMTQHGIFGTLISVDDEKNEAIVETTPGTRLRIHRQTISRVVEPEEIAPEEDVVADDAPAGEPEFGERVVADEADESPTAAPKPRKKSADGSAE